MGEEGDVSARPIREHVPGAPYQHGDRVRVVGAIDRDAHDVSEHIDWRGTVDYLEYSCGCGQTYPGDPMIGVVLDGGAREEFWSEELTRLRRRAAKEAGDG